MPPTPDTSGGFYLNQLAPPQPPKRWPAWKTLLLIVVCSLPVVGAFAVLAAIDDDEPAEPSSQPTSQSTGMGTPAAGDEAAPGDGPGRRACTAVKAANATGRFDATTLAGIALDGMRSTERLISIAATALSDEAVQAKQGAADTDGVDLRTAAIGLEASCKVVGYYT